MIKHAFSLLLLGSAVAAQATIVIEDGNFVGGENVMSGPIEGPAILVKGEVNGGPIVNFVNNDGNEMTYTGGQASLSSASDLDPLSDFTVSMDDAGLWIRGMGMSLDADDNGSVLFTVFTNEGLFTDTLDLSKNGINRYRILADGATQILSVRMESSTQLDSVKQVRIESVPEPATMAALALGAAGFLRRRSRK